MRTLLRRWIPIASVSKACWVSVAVLLVAVALFPSFYSNALGVAREDFFLDWQQDSQSLVENVVESGPASQNHGFWGLSESRKVQIGTQGHFFSGLGGSFDLNIRQLEGVSAALSALWIAGFIVLVALRGSVTLAMMIAVVSFFSPWLVAAARNLYWIPWSWYALAVIAGCAVIVRNRVARKLLFAGLFAAFAFRFSAGYEYVTSMILFAAVMPFVLHTGDPFASTSRKKLVRQLRLSTWVFATGLASFLTVLLVHGFFRGEGRLWSGLQSIYVQDVLRRTYGDPANFDPVYEASLTASPLDVLQRYFFQWGTPLINIPVNSEVNLGLGAYGLALLIAMVSLGLVPNLLEGRVPSLSSSLLFLAALAVPISWFVLAKGHSFIHVSINFVLWYPITVPVLLYVIIVLFVPQVSRLLGQLRLSGYVRNPEHRD